MKYAYNNFHEEFLMLCQSTRFAIVPGKRMNPFTPSVHEKVWPFSGQHLMLMMLLLLKLIWTNTLILNAKK